MRSAILDNLDEDVEEILALQDQVGSAEFHSL